MPFFSRHLEPSVVRVREGQWARFECRIAPPDATVEWRLNERPLVASHRFKCGRDAGSCWLEITSVQREDAGTVQCVSKSDNSNNEQVKTSSKLCVKAPKSIVYESQMARGIERLERLEREHYATQAGDDYDQQQQLKCNYDDKEDNYGDKKVRSVKKDLSERRRSSGAWSVCEPIIRTRTQASSVTSDTHTTTINNDDNNDDHYDDDDDDDHHDHDDDDDEQASSDSTPIIVEPLMGNARRLVSGQSLHLECRVAPANNANIEIEFRLNEKRLDTTGSSRMHASVDFGYVALDIGKVDERDSGTYKVRAINRCTGRTCDTCFAVRVKRARNVQTSSFHASALPKLAQLELANSDKQHKSYAFRYHPAAAGNSKKKSGPAGLLPHDKMPDSASIVGASDDDADDDTGTTTGSGDDTTSDVSSSSSFVARPTFQRPLFAKPVTPASVSVNEGDARVVELSARVVPTGDASMHVEWLLNGAPLLHSNRHSAVHEFGAVSLTIRRPDNSDSGVYTCIAHNRLGRATSAAVVHVRARPTIERDTLNADSLASIRALEAQLECERARSDEQQPARVIKVPRFTRCLPRADSHVHLHEGDPLHLECHVSNTCHDDDDDDDTTPQWFPDDDTHIEWYRNGHVVVRGARLHTLAEYGVAMLDIDYVHARDAGEYVCRVANSAGAVTSTVRVHVAPDERVVSASQLARPLSAQRLHELEFGPEGALAVRSDRGDDDKSSPVFEALQFVTPNSPDKCVQVNEGELFRFEATLARSTAQQPQQGQRGQSVTAEADGEPDIEIEWLRDAKPIEASNRYRIEFEPAKRVASLEVGHAEPHDTGTYVCRARVITRRAPQFVFNTTTTPTTTDTTTTKYDDDYEWAQCCVGRVQVRAKPALDTSSQLPESMRAGYQRLARLEHAWANTQPDEVELEDEYADLGGGGRQEPRKPEFVARPQAAHVRVGQTARFCCRVGARPRARVTWSLNGTPIEPSVRHKMRYDGMYHLEIRQCQASDAGWYGAHARNALGQCHARAQLQVDGAPVTGDYRHQLRTTNKAWYDTSLSQYQAQRAQDTGPHTNNNHANERHQDDNNNNQA